MTPSHTEPARQAYVMQIDLDLASSHHVNNFNFRQFSRHKIHDCNGHYVIPTHHACIMLISTHYAQFRLSVLTSLSVLSVE